MKRSIASAAATLGMLSAGVALGAAPPAVGIGVDAAPLREGLWVIPDPECRFDAAKPVSRWPRCAWWGVIRDGAWLHYGAERRGGLFLPPPVEGQVWARAPFALPPGERRVLQLKTNPFGEDGYQFLEVRAERFDDASRITVFTMGFPARGRPFAWKPATLSAVGFDPFPEAEAAACALETTGRCESGEPYLDFTLTWVREPRSDDFARP